MKDKPNAQPNADENINTEVVDDTDDEAEDGGESWTAGDDDEESWIEEAQKKS
jgi:hypothetical protein